MKRKNIKPLVMSSLAALSLGSLSVAGTFALFTDKAETTIQVGSGKVQVSQTLSITSVSELNGVAVSASDGVYTNSIGGTTKINSNGELELSKWAPGDKAVIEITNANGSDVSIKTRFVVSHTTTSNPDLWNALTVTYEAVDANNNNINHKFMDWSVVDPSVATISKVRVTIEFKDHDNGEIRFDDSNLDNQYQNCNCKIVFAQEAVQGNAHTDSLIDQLNYVLDSSSAKNNSLYDAITELQAANDQDWGETLLKNNIFLWNSATDRFVYRDEAVSGEEYKYFRVYDSMPAEQVYSVYASSSWSGANVGLTGIGFDAGSASGITSVSYIGAASARENTIRTNSAGTALTINAPFDTVHHYGTAGSLNIIAVANSSYHENGKVAFAEIAKGRIALEKTAEVSQLHLTAKSASEGFEEIIIAKDANAAKPEFTRDAVSIPEAGRLVVALQETTDVEADKDYVWLTAVGIYEQITVSDSKTEAGTTWVDTSSKSNDTKETAKDIANNIAVTVGETTYTVQATGENRSSYVLVEEGSSVVSEDYSVESASIAVQETQEQEVTTVSTSATVVVKEAGTENVVVNTATAENGISEAEKEEVKVEAEKEVISEEVQDDESNYAVRIGFVGYATLDAALAAAVDGDVITFMKDIEVEGAITSSTGGFYDILGKEISFDLGNYKIINKTTGGRLFYLGEYAELTIIAKNGGMEIPESNTNSYGFIRVDTHSTLNIDGGNYVGLTDNGAFIHVKSGSYTTIKIQNVNFETDYRVIASPGYTWSSLDMDNCVINHTNMDARSGGQTVPAIWLCGFLNASIDGTKITSEIGNCVTSSYSDLVLGHDKENVFTVKYENEVQPWNSVAIAIETIGNVTVDSGTYSGSYGLYIFTSGGYALINGGTFVGSTAALQADADKNSYSYAYAFIDVYDAKVNGNIGTASYGNAEVAVTLYGGTYSVEPLNCVVPNGYSVIENNDDTWTVLAEQFDVVSVVPNEDGITATVTYESDAVPDRFKTEQVRYLTAKNLGSQTTDTTFDVYCGEELIVSGATFSNIFNYNETLLGRNVLVLPEGDIYFNGDSYIRSDAIFMIGAKDGEGKPATRLLANGSSNVGNKGLQIQNRSGSLATRNFYFENIIFDGSKQANKWGHLMTMTSYGIDAEFNNVLFQNFTQASRTALIGVWANQTIDGTNSYPTANQNLGVDIRFTNVNVDNINNKPIFQFQGLEAGHILAVPDCFSYISVEFDQASGTNCGLYSNAAFCTQVNDNLYDYGVHYLWMVNGVEIKSVSGTSVIVY